MSGTSAVVHEVWCYTKREDVVESAVRAVRASVKSAVSQRGASVWVWTKAETQTAMDDGALPRVGDQVGPADLRWHLPVGIEIGKITKQQKKADVYVEVRVEKLLVAEWRVHVYRMGHVASAGTEEPATVEAELEAAKKALEVAAAEIKRLREQLKTKQAPTKTEFDVILEEVPFDKKIAVVKAVRMAIQIGLIQAKTLVESVPVVVQEGIGKDAAEAIKKQLEEAGGKVTVK
jgi:ribosomal protein L7/L12